MDPIKTLGTILKGHEQRDAIHIAILPATAGEKLWRGQSVTLAYGTSDMAISSREDYGLIEPIGIVDPFLKDDVKVGERFWIFLSPNSVTGMRHHWEHPLVDHPQPVTSESEKWLRAFSERWSFLRDYGGRNQRL